MADDAETAPLLRRLLPTHSTEQPGISTYHSRFGTRNLPGRVLRTTAAETPAQSGQRSAWSPLSTNTAAGKTKPSGKGPQGRRAVCIHQDRRTEYTTLRRHMLTSDLQLRHRDLRALDPTVAVPYPSAIFIRSNAWVINLEGLKAIISQDTLLIISVPALENLMLRQAPTIEHPAVQYLAKQLSLIPGVWEDSSGTVPSSEGLHQALYRGPSYQSLSMAAPDSAVQGDAASTDRGTEAHSTSNPESSMHSAVLDAQQQRHNGSVLAPTASLVDLQQGPGPPPGPGPLVGSGSAWEQDVLRALHSLEDSDAEAQPFQLRAIEASLCLMTYVLEREVSGVERHAYPLLRALRQRISRSNLEAMHDLQNSLSKLVSRVGRLKEVLEDLLDEEAELTGEERKAVTATVSFAEEVLSDRNHSMAEALDLAGPVKSTSGHSRDKFLAQGHDKSQGSEDSSDGDDELEEVLEAYWLQTDGLLSRVQQLRDRISHTELLLNLDLDSRRNALVALSLVMDLIFLFLEGHMFVSSIFGANIWTGFDEETPYELWPMIVMVFVGTVVGLSLSLTFGIFAKMRGLLFIPDFSFSGAVARTPAR